jgi:hypothetical protein
MALGANTTTSIGLFTLPSTIRQYSSDENVSPSMKNRLQNIFRLKRKRTSPTPSPRLRPNIQLESAAMDDLRVLPDSAALSIAPNQTPEQPNRNVGTTGTQSSTLPTAPIQNHQPGFQFRSTAARRSSEFRRRRSSACLRELTLPEDFTMEDLEKDLELSRNDPNRCTSRAACVSRFRPYPEHGWRIASQPQQAQSSFTTSQPIYSALHHSPLKSGKPYTLYFEGELKPGRQDDGIRLALGFVAGKARSSRMPGCERGSVGIHTRRKALFINHQRVEIAEREPFNPGLRLGIGMTFSGKDNGANQGQGSQVDVVNTTPFIQTEIFICRNGKKVRSWNLDEQDGDERSFNSEGLGGYHDIYAAVGTLGEVNVDIFFKSENWKYRPEDDFL